jgi:hypothetical protein
MISRTVYRCRKCGAMEVIGEPGEWGMNPKDETSVRLSPELGMFVEIAPKTIWHECYKDKESKITLPPLGFGICDFAGLQPVYEEEKEI